jgi:hypothetical protein
MVEHAHSGRIHRGVIDAAAAVGALLGAAVQERLEHGVSQADPFRGMHIDPEDAGRLLARPSLTWDGDGVRSPGSPLVWPATMRASPLEVARRGLHLDDFELAVIVLCLLPEIDGRYGPLIGFLHDDVTRKQPSIELALALLAPAGAASLDYLSYFTPDARLCAWHVLHLAAEDALIRQPLALDRAFLWFLLGDLSPDAAIAGVSRVMQPDQVIRSEGLPELVALLSHEMAGGTSVLLHGEDDYNALSIAALASERCRRHLLVVDGAGVAESETADSLLQRCLREAVLRDLTPCITGAATLLQKSSRHAACRRRLQQCPVPYVLISPSVAGEVAYVDRGVLPVAVPAASAAERLAQWRELAGSRGIALDERTLLALAETEGLGGALLEEVVALAAAAAAAQCEPCTGRHVQQAARSVLRQRGPSLTLIVPRFNWEDIVLPTDRLLILRHLCSRVRYRSRVQRTWGMGRGIAPGVTALFTGPPGTGKSMAAEVIASDLGLDLCKIDLAQVVSK